MAGKPNTFYQPSNGPALDWVPITPGAIALTIPVRAIRANAAGTMTVTMMYNGVSRVMNFAAGEERSVWASHVTAATAGGLEGAI
jgi:hypothetical protein